MVDIHRKGLDPIRSQPTSAEGTKFLHFVEVGLIHIYISDIITQQTHDQVMELAWLLHH